MSSWAFLWCQYRFLSLFLKDGALSGHVSPRTGRFSLAVCRKVPRQHKRGGFCRFLLRCCKTVRCQWSETVSRAFLGV